MKDLISGVLSGVSYSKVLATIASVFVWGLGIVAAVNQIGIATTVTTPVLVTVLARRDRRRGRRRRVDQADAVALAAVARPRRRRDFAGGAFPTPAATAVPARGTGPAHARST
ncbi:hypothetical protein AB0F91_46475 [Amycolatopsis sp. NPDC023774]|uniref:hypothetical protein n=1 Tax=Amycolatopsis sp. NPDC023774 TaxID=3155015 RepID=UPI0033C3F91A